MALPAIGLFGGGLLGGLKKLGSKLGFGGPKDPAAKALAESLGGNIIRLGTLGTAAAPVAGTYYIDRRDGTVYQSKAAGFYPVTDAWAVKRKASWNAEQKGLTSPSYAPSPAVLKAGGVGFLMLAGLAVAFIAVKGLRR